MLIDDLMPQYDFSERHETHVDSSPEVTYRALREFDLARSPIPFILLALRAIPHLLKGTFSLKRRLNLDALLESGFEIVGEQPSTELVIGIAGKFWRLDSGILSMSSSQLLDFEEPGYSKAFWNFRVQESSNGSLLITETRIACMGDEARRKFGFYWRLVGPFSAFIRVMLLRQIKGLAERAANTDFLPSSP